MPDGPVSVEFDGVRFAYPSADKVSLASLEEVAKLDSAAATRCCTRCRSAPSPARWSRWSDRPAPASPRSRSSLPRLYDVDAGAVRLAGVDVRDLSFDSIRDTLGMVTQDGHLFHESIRANLLLARPEATDEELWDALRRARLADLVASLRTGSTPWSASAATACPAGSGSG